MKGLCYFVEYSVVLNVGEEHEAQQMLKVAQSKQCRQNNKFKK